MKKDDGVKGKEAAKRDLENTLSLYNEAVTRKVVGQLFDDYVKEDEKNYYTEDGQDDYEVYDDSEYYGSKEYDEEYYEEEQEEYDDEEIDYGRQRNFNYDDVMIYSPRRRSGRKTSGKKKKKTSAEKVKSEKNIKNKSPKKKTVYQKDSGKKLKYNAASERSAKKAYVEEYDDGFMTDEDFYENDMNGHKALKTFVIIVFVMFLGFLAFFIYKINGLNQQIEEYQNQIEEFNNGNNNADALNKEIERLKALNDSLTKENESLKAPQQRNDNENESSTEQTTDNSEYVVAAGDNLSKISKKFYGNPNNYQKIMEANNLTDGVVVPGQKLIIPKI